MLKQIEMTCFKQHVDRTVVFAPGVNAIRAPNGSGKSNILLAIAYAFFGSKAMPETLEDTVSYGEPLSKLKVVLQFSFAGVDYQISRGKSGAEITFAGQRVTGQTETIKFIEGLFRTSSDLASKLMLSKQKSVGGALSGGPAVAGRIIEDLAGLDLIDRLVDLIQTNLVSGVTTGVEARIAQLEGQVAEVVVEDLTPMHVAVVDAAGVSAEACVQRVALQENRNALDVELAKAILADEKRLQGVIATATSELAQIDAALAVEAPVAPAPDALAGARAAVEAEKQVGKALNVHSALIRAAVEVQWNKNLMSLTQEASDTQAKSEAAQAQRQAAVEEAAKIEAGLNKLQRESAAAVATLEGKLIKESTCTFCDKDLTDVPEVVQHNSKFSADLQDLREGVRVGELAFATQLAAAADMRKKYTTARDEADEYLSDLKAVLTLNDKVELIYAGAADFITVDRSTVPGQWSWTGPAVGEVRPDVAGALAKLEAQHLAATKFDATRAAQQVQRSTLQVKHEAAVLDCLGLQIKDANETLAEAVDLDAKLVTAGAALQAAKLALSNAEHALVTKKALQEQAARAAAQVQAQIVTARAELKDAQVNNTLLKKIRAARPQITDKLWSIVLATVTKYFSQVRGTHSVITRADNGFQVNGRPVSGLSGAEEDVLGLAVRLSLTKTFLPNIDFLILDEVAAACDEQRETAMLGLLSTVGFGQVILVSHADIVDSFADHVISL